MLKPYKIDMYVYAMDEREARELERSLKDFVNRQRERGVAVTAEKLNAMLKQYGDNILITNFLR
jgi:hypothetical protein